MKRQSSQSAHVLAVLLMIAVPAVALANAAYDAWDAGNYDEALQGFLEMEIERPNNRDLGMNVGSAYYMLGDFDKAATQFELLTQKGTPLERSQAHYNLGNTKYRQGKLDEALEAFQKTVELNPEDKDAQFNLEYVRDEIRRRHEEAQKNQQNQEQQQQQQQQQQEQDQNGQENEQDQQDPQNTTSDDQEYPRESDEPDAPQNANPEKDGSQDQPEDQAEPKSGDEAQPDKDGQAGSSADTGDEGDGKEEAGAETAPSKDGGEPRDAEQALTPEEAQRYLDALDPDRPPSRKRARKGRRSRKDW